MGLLFLICRWHSARCGKARAVDRDGAPWHVSVQPSLRSTLGDGRQSRLPPPEAAGCAQGEVPVWLTLGARGCSPGWWFELSRAHLLDGCGTSWVACCVPFGGLMTWTGRPMVEGA